MACSSNCNTGPHESWGACIRAKSLRTAYMQEWKGNDATAQKRADKSLDDYAKARSHGIQPKSTRPADVKQAVQISETTGSAFKA